MKIDCNLVIREIRSSGCDKELFSTVELPPVRDRAYLRDAIAAFHKKEITADRLVEMSLNPPRPRQSSLKEAAARISQDLQENAMLKVEIAAQGAKGSVMISFNSGNWVNCGEAFSLEKVRSSEEIANIFAKAILDSCNVVIGGLKVKKKVMFKKSLSQSHLFKRFNLPLLSGSGLSNRKEIESEAAKAALLKTAGKGFWYRFIEGLRRLFHLITIEEKIAGSEKRIRELLLDDLAGSGR